MMVHGAGLDHTVWRYQSRYLAHHGRRVLALDLPGHGRAGGPPLSSVEEMADWVGRQWLEPAGESVALIGHSLGALVALEVAGRFSGLLTRIVLIGSGAGMHVHPDLQAAADRGDARAIDLIIGWSYSRRGRLGGHPEPGLWQTGVTRRMLERGLRSTLAIDLAATASYQRGRATAAAIRCPTLILIGREDRMVSRRAAAELAELIPGARLEVVDTAGHMLPLEAPETVRRLLGDFLPSA
jgi:pimeloyl-ACP methyl ester carboxylesterase